MGADIRLSILEAWFWGSTILMPGSGGAKRIRNPQHVLLIGALSKWVKAMGVTHFPWLQVCHVSLQAFYPPDTIGPCGLDS